MAVIKAGPPKNPLRRKPIRYPETELALAVLEALAKAGWETYQEVSPWGASRADIVAKKDGKVLIVEVKCQPSMNLIAQALHWKKGVHAVAVATVDGRYGDFREILRALGIDFIRVSQPWNSWNRGKDAPNILEADLPSEWTFRKPDDLMLNKIVKGLSPLHNEMGKAGSSGSYFTVFKATCLNLAEYVKEHPGCTLKDAVANISHHYSSPASARGSLGHWIGLDKVAGVMWDKPDKDAKVFRLYPNKETK